MSGDNYQYHIREIQAKKSIGEKQLLMIVGIIAILGFILYFAYQEATQPPTVEESLEIFMQAWSDWDSDIVEAMVPSDFYVRASRQWGLDWLERNRPTSWEIGEPFSRESIEMGRGFVDVDIDTPLLGEVELLVFFEHYTSGWKIVAMRTVD